MTGKSLQNVLVPWNTATTNDLRVEALRRVMRHLGDAGYAPLSLGVPPSVRWSPGAARNRAAFLTTDPVIVFNDADTVCPARQIAAAISTAAASGSLVYAYTVYQREDADGRVDRELINPPSMGCVAISRAAFDRVGGFDERFSGWGYEDVDFARRCQSSLGPIRRIDGAVRHVWHGDRHPDDSPMDTVERDVRANRDLMGEIQAGRVPAWSTV